MRRAAYVLALLGAVALLGLAGPGNDDADTQERAAPVDWATATGSEDAPPPPTTAPGPTTTTTEPAPVHVVASATVPEIVVLAGPGGPETHRLANPSPPYDTDLLFLVTEQQGDWLEVMLPVRPNGTRGWIRAADVELSRHTYRIEVSLGQNTITVFNGHEIFHQEAVGLGKAATPTPGGVFYTKELLIPYRQPWYGPYAYGLSGFSDVLYSFAGGEGQLGIHGTDAPRGLGTDISNGCIRMSNAGITLLAETLPLGVPVEIVA